MKYTEPKQLADGRFFVRASKDDNTRLFIQLNSSKIINSDELTLEVSSSVVSKIHQFDSEILQDAKVNSVSWFGRDVQQKTLDTAYSKSVTSDNCMNIVKSSKVPLVYYDVNKNVKNETELENGTLCDILIECVGIWFLKKTFGVQWRLVQVRDTKPIKKQVYLFEDDEEEKQDDDDDYM
jgi:hypothetical protein